VPREAGRTLAFFVVGFEASQPQNFCAGLTGWYGTCSLIGPSSVI
jgi:hypothetical protein